MPIDPDLPQVSDPEEWTDAQLIHVLESSGTSGMVARAIHGPAIDFRRDL